MRTAKKNLKSSLRIRTQRANATLTRSRRRGRRRRIHHHHHHDYRHHIARACMASGRRTSGSPVTYCSSSNSKVSNKLQALKNLINPGKSDVSGEDGEVKPENLFKETADYIVLLRTRVVVLQKLIEFYGSTSSSMENQDHVVL